MIIRIVMIAILTFAKEESVMKNEIMKIEFKLDNYEYI